MRANPRLFMQLCVVALLAALSLPALASSTRRQLPLLRDGVTISGPGRFHYSGTLKVKGTVTLRDLDLDLRGPIVVEAHAHLLLDHVHLRISDPPGAPNGTSGLTCEGPASLTVRDSSMDPVGSAHPMWLLQGDLDVQRFATTNSEFHLQHTTGKLDHLKIFELEISNQSRVTAEHLDLVFFSNHTSEDEAVSFRGIPTEKPFSRQLNLGSGAYVDLKDARVQIFLIYVHGRSRLSLADMGRVQLALNASCHGSLTLPSGTLGADHTFTLPEPATSDCPFRFSLDNVHVDSWDVYAGGQANLSFTDSVIDELTASSDAHLVVSHSKLFADWLALSDHATLSATDSRIGALSMTSGRPDLATSQVRLTGQSRATFTRDSFDCGIYVSDRAEARLIATVAPPQYRRQIGQGRILMEKAAAAPKP